MERGQAIRVDTNAIFKLEYKVDLEAFLHMCDYTLLAVVTTPDPNMRFALLHDYCACALRWHRFPWRSTPRPSKLPSGDSRSAIHATPAQTKGYESGNKQLCISFAKSGK